MLPSTTAPTPRSPHRRRRAPALAFALGALLASPAVQAQGVRPAPLDRAAIEELSRETLKTLYEKWGTVLLQSGYRVTLELRDFRSYLPEEYASIRAGAVLTLAPDRRLQLTPSVRADQFQHSFGITYTPEWIETERDPAAGRDPIEALTVAEALAASEDYEPGVWKHVAAITSYQVDVRALGRGVTYRALLYWLELPSGDDPGAWRLRDPVADLVVETSRETRRVAPEDVLERELTSHMDEEVRQMRAERERAGESKN